MFQLILFLEKNAKLEIWQYLFQFYDIFVKDVAPFRREESNGGEEQHHVLVRPPLRVEGLDEPLVLLVQVHAQLRRLFQHVHPQLARSAFTWKLKFNGREVHLIMNLEGFESIELKRSLASNL